MKSGTRRLSRAYKLDSLQIITSNTDMLTLIFRAV